jgi:hypothetical protein
MVDRYCHPVPGREPLRHGGLAETPVIGMDYQVSKIPTITLIPSFKQ